jgi:phosphate-selective porin
MRRTATVFLGCALALVLTSAAALAQAVSTAQINGAIKDSGGLALPGVTVTMTQDRHRTGTQRHHE